MVGGLYPLYFFSQLLGHLRRVYRALILGMTDQR
ncbi:hypothetical protein COMA1_70121 [Candidatus Nitrospira nitrosa]|uniref:Uncharacterized protein n=1 Tax=Candidatus Nitrospira nitrosa TaxID=1742972 RepID=A0A0S4LTF1_9BACT|nr:hypothetical protein COMA1_70121 [Candidatus Nitrospira nitrosa]